MERSYGILPFVLEEVEGTPSVTPRAGLVTVAEAARGMGLPAVAATRIHHARRTLARVVRALGEMAVRLSAVRRVLWQQTPRWEATPLSVPAWPLAPRGSLTRPCCRPTAADLPRSDGLRCPSLPRLCRQPPPYRTIGGWEAVAMSEPACVSRLPRRVHPPP